MEEINFIARWGHLVFGITWIGMLYYFNFVQGGYFKSASPEGLADAKAKLAPSALWWFRWGAMFTFLTGLYLISYLGIALGMKEGDGPAAAAKALLASRTNVLFSGPMSYFMLASTHKKHLASGIDTGLFIALSIVVLLELNALFGKQGPIASVNGVIGCSVALTAILAATLHFV